MKNKRKQISNEISIRILSVVITIFVIFSIVVAIMIGNISLSSQKDELELQSKAAAYQLETFFKKYTTTVEQMALNPDIREILTETKSGDSIKEATLYQDVFKELQSHQATDSENILAAWIGDIDANVLTQSDGYTSDSSFDITQRDWYQVTQTGKSAHQRLHRCQHRQINFKRRRTRIRSFRKKCCRCCRIGYCLRPYQRIIFLLHSR